MHILLIKIFKLLKQINRILITRFSTIWCKVIFYLNGVYVESFSCSGFPRIHVSLNAHFVIGRNFKMNNGVKFGNSGLNGKCLIEVRDNATLIIGNDVGLSDVSIICHEKITIGNNVLIGLQSQIRDTDNHSLNPQDWLNGLDWKNKKTAPISIGDNVFIGGCSIILKGVTIGSNAIVGAGSIVTKDIPPYEIWAGNPAVCIKKHINL